MRHSVHACNQPLHRAEVEQVDVGVSVEGRALGGYVGTEKDALERGIVVEFQVTAAFEVAVIAGADGHEETVTPSPGFASSVLQAVRAVHPRVPLVAFPWRRLAAGAAASLALAALTAAGLALTSGANGLHLDTFAVTGRLSIVTNAQFAFAAITVILTLISLRLLFEYMTE